MPKAKDFARTNPVFARAQMGVEANHSSAVPSTDHTENLGHEQNDEDLQDVGPPEDPNISGNRPTEDCYTFVAGSMDGWRENDDYRRYFGNSIGCDGMLVCDPNDGDYDDNGGIPTATGHDYGVHGPYRDETAESESREVYPLGPITRYI